MQMLLESVVSSRQALLTGISGASIDVAVGGVEREIGGVQFCRRCVSPRLRVDECLGVGFHEIHGGMGARLRRPGAMMDKAWGGGEGHCGFG